MKKDTANAMFFGVCSGLAVWSGVDVTLVRLGFVVGTFLGVGMPILIYLGLAVLMPKG